MIKLTDEQINAIWSEKDKPPLHKSTLSPSGMDRIRAVEAEVLRLNGLSGWQPIETAPKDGALVVVYWPNGPDDWPDGINVAFDYFCQDYENWFHHSEAHEHYMAVGGSNACGPDVVCTGPSEKAPYTHWMPLPPAPQQGGE